ncbi:MAG: succinate-semialdehyde dehydrogenase [Bacteroidetes bacterium]|nr:MAG: succinate-semialdehyde dehydrogenase [Bacteroidota bacterium]
MVEYRSLNPYSQIVSANFPLMEMPLLMKHLAQAEKGQALLSETILEARVAAIEKLAHLLRAQKDEFAETISSEMGKIFPEAKAEIEKCAWLCDFYAEHIDEFLSDTIIESDADLSFATYAPLGVILGIMPWNFPFWQVFRFAVPTILAGNSVLLKPAPNCPQSALTIEKLFASIGLPAASYQNIFASNEDVGSLIEQEAIAGISLTGSTRAGSAVAERAGKALKRQVLELGGSNAFIIMADADLQKAAQLAAQARLLNAGQSCIAAKRFIVHMDVYEDFLHALKAEFEHYKIGDPMAEGTKIGPLARPDLCDNLERQFTASMEMGARLITGGVRDGNFFTPTILADVNPEMPVFKEEVFGPLAAVMSFKSTEEAIKLSNDSNYGLGCSLIGRDSEALLKLVPQLKEGAVFINELVKSDPRLPFGGIKNSGYGRELAKEGALSFVNVKTVYLKK